jgi:hypothetical protein
VIAVLALASLGVALGMRKRSGGLYEPPTVLGTATAVPSGSLAAGPRRQDPLVNMERLEDSRYSED